VTVATRRRTDVSRPRHPVGRAASEREHPAADRQREEPRACCRHVTDLTSIADAEKWLTLDPDEDGLHQNKMGSTKLLHEISKLAGPYGSIIRKANCCVDDWWPDPSFIGTNCAGGCPADLTCNQ
jgi:hypothetical protein